MAKNQFRRGFEQKTKHGRVRVSFLKLGTIKIVLKQPVEIRIVAPKPIKEKKNDK